MDERSIYDIKPISFSFEKLNEIVPIRYKRKADNAIGIGIGAQQLIAIEPSLVRHHANGTLEVDYQKLSVVLLAVVKELSAKVDSLENNLTSKKKANARI